MLDTLRLTDVESVFQLVNECRELWADVDAWQSHLLRGACRLTGMAVSHYNEQRLAGDLRSTHILDETYFGSWRDDAARDCMMRVYADHPDRTSYFPRCTQLAGRALRGMVVTALRPHMRSDHAWYRSAFFNEYRRPASIDGFILSFGFNPTTASLIMLITNQDVDDPAPTARAGAILSFLTRQISPLVGTTLTTRRQRGLHGLSPRAKQTLRHLLAGDSEKQIAQRLNLSHTTVHDYVGGVYRHFKVASRAELMAYFLQHRPSPAPNDSIEADRYFAKTTVMRKALHSTDAKMQSVGRSPSVLKDF